MPFKKTGLNTEDFDIKKFPDSFIPYLYLDGHRSSNVADTDIEKYKNGLKFFLRFGELLKELGFKEMVTMVHTARNCCIKNRIEAIQSAIQEGMNFSDKYNYESKFILYGDIEAYKNSGFYNFYNFLKEVENTKKNTSFTHHILINYSEDWAINNLEKIKLMPEISSVIRFTKGYVSGGWIPYKMQESIFIYSQIPSVSDFWSDEAIKSLISISIENWSVMKQFIGKKSYEKKMKLILFIPKEIYS